MTIRRWSAVGLLAAILVLPPLLHGAPVPPAQPAAAAERTPRPTHIPRRTPTTTVPPVATDVTVTPFTADTPTATTHETMVPILDHTATPTAEPTAEPAVVLPTPAPVPPTPTPAALIEGVPACGHDPEQWHGLVERDAQGAITCTYGHTHYDDPHSLDADFGAGPAAWWGGDQEISYPWQTFNNATGALENDAKHRVYKWQTISDPTCRGNPDGKGLSYDRIRVQAHMDGNGGAAVRYHSFGMELRTCDPANPGVHGFIRTGGWLDYGYLEVRNDPQAASCPSGKLCPNGNQFYIVPLVGDPAGYGTDAYDPNGYRMGAARRGHGSPEFGRAAGVWYGNSKTLLANPLGIVKEDSGPVDPNNPTAPLFYPSPTDGCSDPCNGSFNEPVHLLSSTVTGSLDFLDGKLDGFVNLSTFTDRYGEIDRDGSCTAVGLDCVPLLLSNVKVGSYNFRSGATTEAGAFPVREYDVKSPVTGKSLIQYPN